MLLATPDASPAKPAAHRTRWMTAWLRFLIWKLARLALVLLVLLFATFMIIRLIPGDPARLAAGFDATPQDVANVRAEMGLDEPLPVQFASYVGRVLHLDLGRSFSSHEPVETIIADRLPRTAELAVAALVLVMLLSLPIGIAAAAATREGRHRRGELAFGAVSSLLSAVPEYLAATFLVFLLAVKLGWLPVAGSDDWNSIVLPALAIAITPTAHLARIVRVETLNVLAQDYIRTARSKRLPTRLLYLRHVLPNVLTAALTIGGLIFASLIGGAIIVENVFAWPGLGTAVVQALISRDFLVVQAAVLLLGAAVVIVNTVVDLVLGAVNPRSLVRS
jgi:peptide/nickel transport system permease protein